MTEESKEVVPPKEEKKEEKECKKEGKCCKKTCPNFWGYGPNFCPGWNFPPHEHKERKCECGEIIPKRKKGEPKIKECPKCKKELPKKEHHFGMRCRKMKKLMKYMSMCGGYPFCPPTPQKGFEVNHYIHFDNSPRMPWGGYYGRPPYPPYFGMGQMWRPFTPFGRPHFGWRHRFGFPPMHRFGYPMRCFGRYPMGMRCFGPFGRFRPY